MAAQVNKNSQIPRKQNQLVVFDQNGKVEYFDKLGLQIYKQTLIITPNNDSTKKIEATFNQNFFQRKNILCVLNSQDDNTSFQRFAIIFASDVPCKNIFTTIRRSRQASKIVDNLQPNEIQGIYEKDFFAPIIEAIDKDVSLAAPLTEIVYDYLNSLQSRQRYLILLKEANSKLLSLPKFKVFEEQQKQNQTPSPPATPISKKQPKTTPTIEEAINLSSSITRKRKHTSTSYGSGDFDERLPQVVEAISASANFDSTSIFSEFSVDDLKRPIIKREISQNEEEENENRHSVLSSSSSPNNEGGGSDDTSVINFATVDSSDEGSNDGGSGEDDDSDANSCYTVDSDSDDDGPPEKRKAKANELSINQRIESCRFEVKIYTKNGQQRSKLIIFTSADRTKCFSYNYDKRRHLFYCTRCQAHNIWVRADMYCDENGDEFIKPGLNAHICKPIQYVPENYENMDSKIVKLPFFKIIKRKVRGKLYPRLVIFNPDNEKLCREYSWAEQHKHFYCTQCQNKKKVYVFAKIIHNERKGGEVFVQLGRNEHACDEQEYVPEDMAKNIVRKPDFEINVLLRSDGSEKKQLTIIDSKDRKKFYIFHFATATEYFICNGCAKKRKHTAGKLREDKDGNEYIEMMGDGRHVCYDDDFKAPSGSSNNMKSEGGSSRSRKPVSGEIVRLPDFEMKSSQTKTGKVRRKLVIFDSDDRTLGYTYYYCNTNHWFVCNGCVKHQKLVTARLHKDETDGSDYIELLTEHVCEPQKWLYENNKIINSPDFQIEIFNRVNGKERKRLTIFNLEDKSFYHSYFFSMSRKAFVCHECAKLGKYVSAKVHQNEDGQDYIEMGPTDHLCKPKNTEVDETMDKSTIISKPNFRVETYTKSDGTEKKRLIVTDPNDENLSYNYFYDQAKDLYVCSGCNVKRKHRSAKIRRNETDGEEYLELFSTDHVCQSKNNIKNSSVKIEESEIQGKIISADGFKIETHMKVGEERKRLVVFGETDKMLVYTYYYANPRNAFVCNGCAAMKKYVWAKMHHKEDGEPFLELGPIEHFCSPVQRAIVEKPNFKVETFMEPDGTEGRKLFLFTSDNKDLCYTYTYDENKDLYTCPECSSKRKFIHAKIHQKNADGDDEDDEGGGGEEYVEMLSTDHICNLKSSSPETLKGNVIKEDGFKIVNFTKGGVQKKRLIVYAPENRDLYYAYHYSNSRKAFVCNGCAKLMKYVTAKMHKTQNSGESVIELCQTEHFCEPQINDGDEDLESAGTKKIILREQPTEFKVEHFTTTKNIQRKRLIIFSKKDPTKCYIYSYVHTKIFGCNGCQKLKQQTTIAKLCQDSEEKYFVELENIEHICKPEEYIPMEIKTRIVNLPNFKVEKYTDRKIERKILTVFATEDHSLCYNYYFIPERNIFTCVSCKEQKRQITARVFITDEGEDYLKLSELDHVCEPEPSEKELQLFEYELQWSPRQTVEKVIVFDMESQNTMCYEFVPYRDNRYRCKGCMENEKLSELKLFENELGHFYAKMGELNHFCLPTKYFKKEMI